jgi:hypothetical protein
MAPLTSAATILLFKVGCKMFLCTPEGLCLFLVLFWLLLPLDDGTVTCLWLWQRREVQKFFHHLLLKVARYKTCK